MITKMAWRNLWRQKRRTLITTSTVAFGLWMAVTFTSLGEHSYSSTIETGAKMGWGHVAVLPDGYLEAPGLEKRVGGSNALAAKARQMPEVVSANARISGQAIFTVGGRSRGGQFFGIDAADEDAASNFFVAAIVEGELFASDDRRGVVIGRTMADKLKLELGKKIVYTTTDKDGEMVSDVGRVRGIFETGVDSIDGGVVLLPIGPLRQTLGYGEDESTAVIVLLEEQRYAQEVQERLAPQVPVGAAVLTWQESMADLVSYIALDRASNQFFQLFIGLLVTAGLLNTILMSVLERQREFGVMMAVGMSPWRLFQMVMTESVFIALVGLVLGAVVTTPWAIYMHEVGLDFSVMMGGETTTMNGVIFDPVMRFNLPLEMLLGILAALFTLTLVAGLYPAIKAGRVPPVESLRVI